MRIGIGCSTYNRPKHLELWLKQFSYQTGGTNNYHKLREGDVWVYRCNDSKYKLHVADDSQDRKGIAYRKNECLRALKDCDYIFLMDDDCFPIKEGWAEFFVEASKASGQQHFMYLKETPTIKKINNWTNSVQSIDIYDNCAGCFMFLTKEVIEKVGAFGDYPAPYGFEHAGYSDRIHAAGLTPLGVYTCPAGAGDYIYAMDFDFHLPFNKMLKHESSIKNEFHLLETYKKNNWHYYQMDGQTIYQPI